MAARSKSILALHDPLRCWILYYPSLTLTAKAPENGWLEHESFPFGMAYFQGLCYFSGVYLPQELSPETCFMWGGGATKTKIKFRGGLASNVGGSRQFPTFYLCIESKR